MQENISLIIYIHMITLLFDVYGQSNFKNVFWKKKISKNGLNMVTVKKINPRENLVIRPNFFIVK